MMSALLRKSAAWALAPVFQHSLEEAVNTNTTRKGVRCGWGEIHLLARRACIGFVKQCLAPVFAAATMASAKTAESPMATVAVRSVLLLALLAIPWQTVTAQDLFDEREENLVQNLRKRSLFDLAEQHCVEFLKRDGLSESDHAAVAIARIATKTAELRSTADRESSGKDVVKIAEDFSADHPQHPRSVLVTMQRALAHLSYANLLQQELEARIGDESHRRQGLQQLSLARTVLEQTRNRATETLQSQSNQTLREGMLSSEQLRALKTNVAYQQAIVNLTSAQLDDSSTESGHLDRIDSLGRVPEQLISVRNSVAQSSSLWWRTWVQEASCRRMLGELDNAARILKSLQRESRPQSVDRMLLREQVELAIAIGDKDRMRALATKAMKRREDAETEIGLIRLLVAAGEIEKASAFVEQVASRHGPWWARRADIALLSGSRRGIKDEAASDNRTLKSANSSMLFEAAEKAQRNGDLAAAADGYLAVAESQFSAGDRSAGLATSVRAALVFEKQEQHERAAEVLLKPARAYPQETSSSSIFLRACWNLSRVNSPSYPTELKALIRKWPESNAADQARHWLSGSLIQSKQYGEAFATLIAIKPSFKDSLVSIALARSAATLQLRAAESDQQSTKSLVREIFESWATRFESSTDLQKPAVAVAMAELSLGWSAEDRSKTIRRMQEVSVLPAVKDNQEYYYFWALLSDGEESANRFDQAEALGFSPSSMLRLLELSKRIEDSQQLAEKQLRIAEHGLTQVRNVQRKRAFQNARAAALVTLDRRDEAEAIYRQMMQDDPKDQTAILELARMLDGQQALKVWRLIASRAVSHTHIWYEAKYNVARLLLESGNSGEAAKMLKYIKAVPPGWSKSKLKSEFETLLRKSSQ